jgi:hypothetical protein
MDEPTVNVKYSDYSKMRDDLRTMQNRIYALEQELATAQIADTSGTAKQLHDAFHEMIKVVQFAVGNLDPQTVAGWPHAALVAVADAIETIPGIDQHVREMPPELRHFAKIAEGYEQFRKERDAKRVVVAASAEDFGPKTPEAALAHAAYKATVEEPSTSPETPSTPT